MARPKKSIGEKRNHIVRVRVTDNEKLKFRQTADNAGLTVSDYIRVKAILNSPQRKKVTPERAELIRGLGELNRIGNNLNQIAKAINIRLKQGDSSALGQSLEVTEALQKVDRLTSELLNLIEHGN